MVKVPSQNISYVTCPDDNTRHTVRFVSAVYNRSDLLPRFIKRLDGNKETSFAAHVDEQGSSTASELDSCTYLEVVSPAFVPNRVLLYRVFYLNEEKSKHISVGLYPAHIYHPMVEY